MLRPRQQKYFLKRPLEIFFERRIFIFEVNKKSSDLGAPSSADPDKDNGVGFCFCSAPASGLFAMYPADADA